MRSYLESDMWDASLFGTFSQGGPRTKFKRRHHAAPYMDMVGFSLRKLPFLNSSSIDLWGNNHTIFCQNDRLNRLFGASMAILIFTV